MRVEQAGFVLAGGRSSRMGTDKALLPLRGKTLLECVASAVAAAAGSAAVVGDPAAYGFCGYPIYPDNVPGRGPLGGLETALSRTSAEWNLAVACDMPGLTAAFLGSLLRQAILSTADCVVPHGPSGLPEPLCAVYNRRCHAVFSEALARGVRKVTDAFASLSVLGVPVDSAEWFANVNTPADWSDFTNA